MTDVMTAREGRLRVSHAEGPPLAGVALPVKSHLSLVTSLDSLADLERDWRSLERVGLRPHGVFQTFDWVRSWAKFHLAENTEAELSIVAGYREDELVVIAPLMKVAYGPVKVLRWLTEPLSQYGDILLAPGECPKAWGVAALSLIKRLRNIDVIRLRHVRADAAIAPFLQETFRDANHIESAPWLDLGQFANDAAYEARYNSNQRKRRKKIRKSLEEKFGQVTFELLDGGSDSDAAMREAIAQKCQWLETRGRHNRILGSLQALDFLKHLSRARDASVRL